MTWRADTHLITTDSRLRSRRTIFFEAPNRRAAIAMLPMEVKKGGYARYELQHVAWLEPF